MKSDCDEQLLITVAFTTPVVLTDLTFSASDPCKRDSQPPSSPYIQLAARAPRTVKLFGNAINMDFDDCESRVPSTELDLSRGKTIQELRILSHLPIADLGKAQTLLLAKFKRVTSLTVQTFLLFLVWGLMVGPRSSLRITKMREMLLLSTRSSFEDIRWRGQR